MAACMHVALALWLKLKLWENSRLYLHVYDLVLTLSYVVAFKKVQDYIMEEGRF
jgi:hypothetical protein